MAPVSSPPLALPTAHALVVFESAAARMRESELVLSLALPAAIEKVAELPAVESVSPKISPGTTATTG